MKKVYHEVREESGTYQPNSPCVSVKAFVPELDEERGLPAIIQLERGKLNSYGTPVFADTKNLVVDYNYSPSVIRKAIKLFDRLTRKTFAKVKYE